MSGGYFNYDQYRIIQIAEAVEQLILQEASTECTEWGPKSHGYSRETLMAFKHGLAALKLAAIYAQRIDWLVSCDDGEDSFHSRLREELAEAGLADTSDLDMAQRKHSERLKYLS